MPLAENQANSKQIYKRNNSFHSAFNCTQNDKVPYGEHIQCLDEQCVVEKLHRIVQECCPAFLSRQDCNSNHILAFGSLTPSASPLTLSSKTIFNFNIRTRTLAQSPVVCGNTRVAEFLFSIYTSSQTSNFSSIQPRPTTSLVFVYKYLSFSNKNIN